MGQALFDSWKAEQHARRKKAALLAQATKVTAQLTHTACSQLTILAPPSEGSVPVHDRHFFMHRDGDGLIGFHMESADRVGDVLRRYRLTDRQLLPFIVGFMEDNASGCC